MQRAGQGRVWTGPHSQVSGTGKEEDCRFGEGEVGHRPRPWCPRPRGGVHPSEGCCLSPLLGGLHALLPRETARRDPALGASFGQAS